jgi:hypothetical protein
MNPEAIRTLFVVVEEGQPEPTMGREPFVRDVFRRLNTVMYNTMAAYDVRLSGVQYIVGPKGKELENLLSAIVARIVEAQRSVAVQGMKTIGYAPGVRGPTQGYLLTVFDVAQGEESKVIMTELPLLPTRPR